MPNGDTNRLGPDQALFVRVASLSEEVSKGKITPTKAGEAVELELSSAFALGELPGPQIAELRRLWERYKSSVTLPRANRELLHQAFCGNFLDELIRPHQPATKLLAPIK